MFTSFLNVCVCILRFWLQMLLLIDFYPVITVKALNVRINGVSLMNVFVSSSSGY